MDLLQRLAEVGGALINLSIPGVQDVGTTFALLAVFLVPLAAALVLIFFGRRLPRGGDWLATGAIATSAVISVCLFWSHIVTDPSPGWSWSSADVGLSWDWITLAGLKISIGVHLDNLNVIMLTMVTVVSTCIFFFSQGYMKGDPYYSRFFAYMAYFCFAMLGLVVVDNLLALFIFWELVGVGSYLLIGFFFQETEPPKASLKAFMVNRVGDVLFMLGIILAWQLFGTLQFREMFAALEAGQFPDPALRAFPGMSNEALLTLAGVLIFCGAVSKSAQVPLHVWLPDAMAGPTPVSALIHAATMVAAGVFMVGRMYPFFTPDALAVIAGVGAVTALVGATLGLVMWDIKKVLAYSTMSQLGYMMLGLGVGGFAAGLFHLMTHACFKACLFLGSGSVIHAVHSQDMRDMGGLRRKMPLTYWTFVIATMALAGVPMFAGYYSKDQIIANALAWGLVSPTWAHWVPFLFGAVGAFMTTFYMLRLVFLTFHGEPRDAKRFEHAHESPAVMTGPLVVLAAFALFAGGTNHPLPHTGDLWFNRVVAQPPSAAAAGLGLHGPDELVVEAAQHAAHMPALWVSVGAILLGWLLARAMYLRRSVDAEAVRSAFGPLHRLVSGKYYVDELYGVVFVGGLRRASRFCAMVDRWVIDGFVHTLAMAGRFVAFLSGLHDRYVIDGLVNFWRFITRLASGILRIPQTGNVRDYLSWTLLGVLILAIALA